jgi:hypothetical protein
VRRVLSEVDPHLTLLGVHTLEDQVDSNFDQQRAVAKMTGLLGILALVLAAVGLYGVVVYIVEHKTNELDTRMALGANRLNGVRLVLRGRVSTNLHRTSDWYPSIDRILPVYIGTTISRERMGSARGMWLCACSGSVRLSGKHHSSSTSGFYQPGGGVCEQIRYKPRSRI